MRTLIFCLAAAVSLSACDKRSQAQKDYDNSMADFDQKQGEIMDRYDKEKRAIESGDTLTANCLAKAKSRKERHECTED
jgi:hypothetical protein